MCWLILLKRLVERLDEGLVDRFCNILDNNKFIHSQLLSAGEGFV